MALRAVAETVVEGAEKVRVAAAKVAEGRELEAPDWAAEVDWAVVEMAVVAKAMVEAAMAAVEEDWDWEAPEGVAVVVVVMAEAEEAMDLAKVVAEMSGRLRR